MRKQIVTWIPLVAMFLFFCLPIAPLHAQETTTQWSLWFGSHYTGLQDYTLKVAEFDRRVEGFVPEFRVNFKHFKGLNTLQLKGNYYDPKRMSFTLQGRYQNWITGGVSYLSYYRQNQRDLMSNLVAREATDRTGSTPGGKMITNNSLNPEANFGYRRQEIKTKVEVSFPGAKFLKIFASHRSILEKGHEQSVQIVHCATCHLESRAIELDRSTHTVSGGVEVDLGSLLLSYQASYRTFSSNVEPYEAFFDTAQHPGNGTLDAEFGSRNIFQAEMAPMAQYPETQKLSHQVKAKANIGTGRLFAQFVNFNAKNTVDLLGPNVTVTGDLNLTGNYGNFKFIYPLFPKTKLIANGYYGRFENDPVQIDVPAWRAGRVGGDLDIFDWTRFSNFTRTELKGNLEFIYQPVRKYRLSFLAGYSTRERDDYPYEGAKDKTTKIRLQGAIKYRPSKAFTGQLKYYFENIENPFAPHNHMFERYGRSGPDSLQPENGAPAVYYYQRDALRFGDITSLPSRVNGLKINLGYRPSQKVQLTVGLHTRFATNADEPQLDYKQKVLQPILGLNLIPSDKFSFFSSYSYLLQTQNGIAAVAMMDG